MEEETQTQWARQLVHSTSECGVETRIIPQTYTPECGITGSQPAA